ncbi:hypothetical protein B296_00034720 [Ensete ventricosum]|uniref:Uncharacterized protein n=1 Tax=Ensete ventricosum TaxID=4639 RepID=A0A426XRV6_ENSVE|nr:hypothetical protein B296_00034720 [Ensete ventricosum]
MHFCYVFRSEHNEESGWVAIARPSARTIGHGQALYRDDRPWPSPYKGGRKWPGLTAASSQGMALAHGQAAGATPAASP